MKLILFFNGWGMDENAVNHLKIPENHELKILSYPYNMKDIDFEKYNEKYLVAWSFGAYYACKLLKENPGIEFKRKIAINGVPETIGNYGIPERILRGTLENITPETLKEFYCNMGVENIRSEREFEDIRKELEFFADNYHPQENIYDIAIIGTRDKIIPAMRQKKYYLNKETKIVEKDMPHYPFSCYKSWDEIKKS